MNATLARYLKKTYGMTPSQFRKTRRKETDVERLIKDEDEK